jgi:putative phage-type endonuclease
MSRAAAVAAKPVSAAVRTPILPGSPEWQEARRGKIGGTAARVIFGCDPWMTEFELWEVLTGRKTPPVTPPMLRGIELEPKAREAYEAETGRIVRPAYVEHPDPAYPWAVASVDGMPWAEDPDDEGGIVEIKCPGRTGHAEHASGVPTHYRVQIEHYLWVTGAPWADFVSYCPESPEPYVRHRVEPDLEMRAALIAAEARWVETYLLPDKPPRKGPRDWIVRDDPVWREAAIEYRAAEAACAEWERKREAARQLLLDLMGEASRVRGHGVTVTAVMREGTLDWKALVAAAREAGIDIEAFRRPSAPSFRVTVDRQG